MGTGTGPTKWVRSAGGTSRSGGYTALEQSFKKPCNEYGARDLYRLRSKSKVRLVP